MNEKQNWIEWIRESPSWLKALIGLITTVIGFVILIQSNYYLGLTVLGAVFLVTVFLWSLYLIFAKTPPLVEGGKGVYRYEKLRPFAVLAIVSVVVLFACSVILQPSRSFIAVAFLGTPTSTPIPSPTSTHLPQQGLRVVDVLVFDNNEDIAPYIDIKLRNLGPEIVVLKRARFTAQSDDFGLCYTLPPTPGALLPSWEYDIDVNQAEDQPFTMPISQQLSVNEADRFIFRFGMASENQFFARFAMYRVNLQLIYDEDNKILNVGDMAFVIARTPIDSRAFFAIPEDPPSQFEVPGCYASQVEQAKRFFGSNISKSELIQYLEEYVNNLK